MIKIGGYFSIVEERAVNQVFKTISRIGMTLSLWWILNRLKKRQCLFRFEYDHLLGPVLYLFYLVLGFASFVWSTDPKYSALQWSMTFESLVFVFLFYKLYTIVEVHFPEYRIKLVPSFAWAIFPILVIFIIGGMIEPDTFYRGMRGGEEKRLGGWIMNPNELGMLASISGALSFLLLQQSRQKLMPLLMILSALIILALTSSRSSAIGFLLIMGILVLQSNNKKLKILMLVFVALSLPLAMKFVIFKDSGGVEEVMSMTGRLPFWKALLNEGIVKEPFFGYGFMRINYTDYFQGLNTYPGKMTHNTFMQVLMNLGFVGLLIAVWQLIATVIMVFIERTQLERYHFFVAVFIPILINSFTEFGIFGEANYGILFYQFLIVLFVVRPSSHLSKADKIRLELFNKKYQYFPKFGNTLHISE